MSDGPGKICLSCCVSLVFVDPSECVPYHLYLHAGLLQQRTQLQALSCRHEYILSNFYLLCLVLINVLFVLLILLLSSYSGPPSLTCPSSVTVGTDLGLSRHLLTSFVPHEPRVCDVHPLIHVPYVHFFVSC